MTRLPEAVSTRIGVLSDGPLRPITLGNLNLDFQAAAPTRLYRTSPPAMRFVQALHWLCIMLRPTPLIMYIWLITQIDAVEAVVKLQFVFLLESLKNSTSRKGLARTVDLSGLGKMPDLAATDSQFRFVRANWRLLESLTGDWR